jgi:hypothetical protein
MIAIRGRIRFATVTCVVVAVLVWLKTSLRPGKTGTGPVTKGKAVVRDFAGVATLPRTSRQRIVLLDAPSVAFLQVFAAARTHRRQIERDSARDEAEDRTSCNDPPSESFLSFAFHA